MTGSLQRQALSRQKTAARRHSILEEQIAAMLREYPEAPADPVDADPVSWLECNRFLKDSAYAFTGREFLRDIARDTAPNVYVGKGRQLGLTELAVGLLLHFATLNPGTVSLYITSNLERAKFFSKYRLKAQTVQTSPKIAKLFDDSDDLVLSRMLKNGSLLLFRSSQNDFEASRALPIDYMIIDECQDMNMLALPVAREAMSASKHGRLFCIGTGAVEGSSWERTFHTGEERQYDPKTKKWRRIQGTHKNDQVHAYYLPQSATGLFTAQEIQDKIASYLSRTIGLQEIEAAWTSGADKPFPESVMRACLIPDAAAVPAAAAAVRQVLGIDFGGGRSKTCLILMHAADDNIHYIDDARIIETSNVDAQVRTIIKYIERTRPAHTVCDIGGGTHQVQTLEAAYGSSLTKGHLMANLTNPFDHQRHERLVNIDKTTAVDELIDMTEQGRLKIPRKFEWIIKHFTAVQSKLAVLQGGQAYTRYFTDKNTANDDACMATVFAMAAHRLRSAGRSRLLGVY